MQQYTLLFKKKWQILYISILFSTAVFCQPTQDNPTDTITSTEHIFMVGNSITYAGEWAKLLNRNDVINWGNRFIKLFNNVSIHLEAGAELK